MTDDPRHGRLGIRTEYNSDSVMKTPQMSRGMIRLAPGSPEWPESSFNEDETISAYSDGFNCNIYISTICGI